MITTFVFVAAYFSTITALVIIHRTLLKMAEHQSKIFRNVVDIKNMLEGKYYEKRD
jgi:hypothetical protein